jgi:hypothetical protein
LLLLDGKLDGRSTQYIAPETLNVHEAKEFVQQVQTQDSSTSLRTQINKLQAELVRVHEHYAKVKTLHNEMYINLVDQFMVQRRQEEGN